MLVLGGNSSPHRCWRLYYLVGSTTGTPHNDQFHCFAFTTHTPLNQANTRTHVGLLGPCFKTGRCYVFFSLLTDLLCQSTCQVRSHLGIRCDLECAVGAVSSMIIEHTSHYTHSITIISLIRTRLPRARDLFPLLCSIVCLYDSVIRIQAGCSRKRRYLMQTIYSKIRGNNVIGWCDGVYRMHREHTQAWPVTAHLIYNRGIPLQNHHNNLHHHNNACHHNNFKLSCTPLSRCFSSFPHGTCSLSVSRPYLAFDDAYHRILRCTLKQRDSGMVSRTLSIVKSEWNNGVLTLYDAAFQRTCHSPIRWHHLTRPQFPITLATGIPNLSYLRFARRYWEDLG